MKKYAFVIENNEVVCYYVEDEQIDLLFNKYGVVYQTKPQADESLKGILLMEQCSHKEQKLTDRQRYLLEREQQKFAESMFTEEDWAIVRENRKKVVSIDEQQREFHFYMQRKLARG